MDHLSKWTLKSLTIGPQLLPTKARFWERAFSDLPPLPGVVDVTIVYKYCKVEALYPNTDCWEYFDRVLIRRDLFPALASVQAHAMSPDYGHQPHIHHYLRRVRKRGLLTSESLAFERDHGVDTL